jgi:predicted RNase H-like HicB family nuclease
MRNRFAAFIERGEKYLIATCPEVPEAHGQGETREEALKDLAASVQSVLEYRREEASAQAGQRVEQTVIEVP